MNDKTTSSWKVFKYDGTDFSEVEEEIAVEFPLTISIDEIEFATIVCTPTDLDDLVIGFLASEGVIRFLQEIKSIQIDKNRGFAYVELINPIDESKFDHSKRFIGSCCGKSRQFYFKSDVKTAKTVMSRSTITIEQCVHLMKRLQAQSDSFQRTGGVHNAALCNSGEIVTIKTDIGRHNALDKLYGHALKSKLKLKDNVIVFSGRISSEVLLKVSKIGIGILISKSAPTDLALKLADELEITTIGFARGQKLNVYTHPERILMEEN
ncbi:formate dehydrogenase accessory sulfurtransferase FdhD [Aquibacillus halophilus]|uniref:Sulfur carrier protein FdhD n=1 Tax=Aquibacillus halophilus TaxID=930132 RepID=A0A6A8DAG3_9BACI|nr:formate dehydrogenase accessory sulfurtransferase FdhD [Aquibacillus halophilus]MRH42733.1 formate dehydrogenase accessory sulfurtransferase FdhD [Aquibacillus halophilus]